MATFPPEISQGVDPAINDAYQLFHQYRWLAQLSDEINAAANLDFWKAIQFVHACRYFRTYYNSLAARGAAAGNATEGIFLARSCPWVSRAAMNADLLAIANECDTAVAWFITNGQSFRNYAQKSIDVNFTEDVVASVTGTKPPALATFIANFRALFT